MSGVSIPVERVRGGGGAGDWGCEAVAGWRADLVAGRAAVPGVVSIPVTCCCNILGAEFKTESFVVSCCAEPAAICASNWFMVASCESTPVILFDRSSIACAFWATVGFLGFEIGGSLSIHCSGSVVAAELLGGAAAALLASCCGTVVQGAVVQGAVVQSRLTFSGSLVAQTAERWWGALYIGPGDEWSCDR